MKKQKKAFTFVELIVAIVIISILATVWFSSYIDSIADSRNSTRIANLNNIKSSLQSQKQNKAIYPLPSTPFNITNSWTIVANQGFINSKTLVTEMDNIPSDPYKYNDYVYSTTRQRVEMQLAATLENYWEYWKAFLIWDYKTVSKNVLPTIVLAKNSSTPIEIHEWIWNWTDNKKLFIFDQQTNNLPYEFESLEPYTDGTSFNDLLTEAEASWKFLQNSNYRTCSWILEENKHISEWYSEEYFIVENNSLTATWCTF